MFLLIFRVDTNVLINRVKQLLLLIFICTTVISGIAGQTRKELEDKRKRLIKEIRETTLLLDKTKKNKKETLNLYFTFQEQIQKRQQLINTFQEEIHFTNQEVEKLSEAIKSLNNDLNYLKEEYAKMMRIAFRQKLNNTNILFIFSANSFNDAFRRWQYLKQYDKYRQKQVRLILETRKNINGKITQLEQHKTVKEDLLISEEQQKQLLDTELDDNSQVLESLKKDESKLSVELSRHQKAHKALNDAIEKIIIGEIAQKEEEEEESSKASVTLPKAPRESDLSGNFNNNRGSLPWPVETGYVSRRFGTQSHPTLKGIQIVNNGVDIRTGKNADVKSVFEGKVAGTQYIPGYENMVIIRHGQYYTVYSNLEEIFVKRGDAIKRRQTIGRVNGEKAEVHFEVWREKQRLNPLKWIAQKQG
ncbi:MAG: peptidoglycan DD-metalloendopeptidase family protein [Bacteroidetes bacterium]|nr:peptidoglycan DD-metalloendopeptidase family protein [Bacteroidota bacterium]